MMVNSATILLVLANSLLVHSIENSASAVEAEASSPLDNLRLEKLKEVEAEIPRELTEKLWETLRISGSVTAVLDEYADKILANMAELIISNGLDPVELPNATLKLIPTGQITLNDGWLQDLSTISRFDSVTSTYESSKKLLTVTIPIKFDTLLFTYRYHTHVLLLNLVGEISGKVENVKIHVTLKFDFNNYQAQLADFNMKDSGKISLKFSGLGLVDWVTNSMTAVVALFLHPVIIAIINSIVKAPLDAVVESVNEIIVCVLMPDKCVTTVSTNHF